MIVVTEVYNLRYTHKCDLWSFGIILWEMCTRQYITLRPGTPESPRIPIDARAPA